MSLADLQRADQPAAVSAIDHAAGLLMHGIMVYLRARGVPAGVLQGVADRVLQGVHDEADSALAIHVEAPGVDVSGVPVRRG